MQLTQLRIAGFKSFVEPGQIPIEPGLTGIVGPNGCGKSNLLEALRWVMGANSARAMRGGEMDDLVFSGTTDRPAREMAEVTLVLDNARRTAPPEFNMSDTLEVVRCMRRGAGSQYKLNGKTVRAKDIRLLFADAATGANSPSLVRQGQISELINAKPQNRRRILEEAAGITGMNVRRHETELKLQAAQDNLERLADVSSELEQQVRILKRHEKKARSYNQLSSNITAFEAFLAHLKWQMATSDQESETIVVTRTRNHAEQLTRESAARQAEYQETGEKLAAMRKRVQEQSEQLAGIRIERARIETGYENITGIVRRLEHEAQRLSDNIRHEQEQAVDTERAFNKARSALAALPVTDGQDNAGEEKQARAELENARADLKRAENDVDRINAALAGKRAEIRTAETGNEARLRLKTHLENEVEKAQVTLKKLTDTAMPTNAVTLAQQAATQTRTNLIDIEKHVDSMEAALQNRRAAEAKARNLSEHTHDALRALETEITGLSRLLSTSGATDDGQPVIARIQVQAGYEKALAAALGDDLQASTDRTTAIHWTGRTCPQQELPSSARPLSDFVDAPDVLAARLSQCGVVCQSDGEQLAATLRPGQRLVTMKGHLWRWDGFKRTPDAPDTAAERLEQQDRLDRAHARQVPLQKTAQAREHEYEKAKNQRINTENDLKALRRKAQETRTKHDRAEKTLAIAVKTADQDALKIENARYACARLEKDLKIAAEAFETEIKPENREILVALETELAGAQSLLNTERDREKRLNDLARNHQQTMMHHTLLTEDVARCQARLETSRQRIDNLARQRCQLDDEIRKARARPDAMRVQLDTLTSEAETLETGLKSTRDALKQCETRYDQFGQAARSAADRVMEARETMAGATARLENATLRLGEISDIARTQFNTRPEMLLMLSEKTLDTAQMTSWKPDRVERHIADLRNQRNQLGAVNMAAEADLAALTARLDEHASETADVSAAIVKFREGVSTLHEEGNRRLRQAFEQVNGHFKRLFAILFDGGEAELRLIDTDDPVAVGLEILAQPPGKRLGKLSLMSGGEQALTATALIFAVFLSSPSPVCVLDEVDAPLDDANVGRFCQMLNEMRKLSSTRFIVITHNPITMSRMDRLVGVTMREKGVSKFVSVNLQTAKQFGAKA